MSTAERIVEHMRQTMPIRYGVWYLLVALEVAQIIIQRIN